MNKLIFWIITISSILVLLHLVSNILAPFIIALIFAYLLQPAIALLCTKFKLSRFLATFIVFILFLSIFVLILVLLVPVMYDQIALFIVKIPNYKNNLEFLLSILLDKFHHLDPDITSKISEALRSITNTLFTSISSFANGIWDYTMATISLVTIVALVPFLLYYFLRDWPSIIAALESLMPVKGKSKVREIAISINDLLAAYIRGQLNICLLMMTYYFICLWLVGIDLALLLSIVAGFFIIIPFIGVLISYSFAAITCVFAFGFGDEFFYVTVIFIVGNILEGYILSPRIIGDRIGLHPVWIIFAVFAAASVFGFVGVLFAIPMAGVIRVLFDHLVSYYRSSRYYTD